MKENVSGCFFVALTLQYIDFFLRMLNFALFVLFMWFICILFSWHLHYSACFLQYFDWQIP